MSLVFARRSLLVERMDVEPLDAVELASILKTLETINAWLGGARATLGHLNRFSRAWPSGQTIRIVDWGTGGADMPRAIVRWARRKRIPIEVTGIDNHPGTLAYARHACRDYPEIRLFEGDVNHLPNFQEPFDYAISSLCLHHLSQDSIIDLLRRSDQVASRGIIMNDLKRSARAWLWIWTLARLTRVHPVVQEDGPLSVRRAFTPRELDDYARQAGLPYLRARTHFGYRLTLAGEK